MQPTTGASDLSLKKDLLFSELTESPSGELQDIPAESFELDDNGNRVNESATFSFEHDRLVRDDSHIYTYDNEGNVTKRQDVTFSKSLNFEGHVGYSGSSLDGAKIAETVETVVGDGNYRIDLPAFEITASDLPALGLLSTGQSVVLTVTAVRASGSLEGTPIMATFSQSIPIVRAENGTDGQGDFDGQTLEFDSFAGESVTVTITAALTGTRGDSKFDIESSVDITRGSSYQKYTWDHRNRLRVAERFNADDSKIDSIKYHYDVFDNWIAQEVYDTDGQLVVSRSFVVVNGQRVAAYVDEGLAYVYTYSPHDGSCLLYTSPSPRDQRGSRMPSSA